MRLILSFLALSLTFALSAQTVTYPYNPDANGDNAVGAVDLLELLPTFGSYFTPDVIEVNGITLDQYLANLEVEIDSLMSASNQLTTEIDSIFIANDELFIVFNNGAEQSFPLPTPTHTSIHNHYHSYSSSEVPNWVLNVKQSDDYAHDIRRALELGLVDDENDFNSIMNFLPEVAFQLPIDTPDVFDCNDPHDSFLGHGFNAVTGVSVQDVYGDDCRLSKGFYFEDKEWSFSQINARANDMNIFLAGSQLNDAKITYLEPSHPTNTFEEFGLFGCQGESLELLIDLDPWTNNNWALSFFAEESNLKGFELHAADANYSPGPINISLVSVDAQNCRIHNIGLTYINVYDSNLSGCSFENINQLELFEQPNDSTSSDSTSSLEGASFRCLGFCPNEVPDGWQCVDDDDCDIWWASKKLIPVDE